MNIQIQQKLKKNVGVLETYTDNQDLLQALKDFIEMRKKSKKPMTDRAINMLLKELDKLTEDEETKIALLEQSILYNWQTVYPLKEDKQTYDKGGNDDGKYGDKIKFNVPRIEREVRTTEELNREIEELGLI